MKTTIVSFLWVAKSYNDPSTSAYQITVRDEPETMEEVSAIGATYRERTLNVEQAKEEGFDITKIIDRLNTSAHEECKALQEALDAKTKELEDFKSKYEELGNLIDGVNNQAVASINAIVSKLEEFTNRVKAK